MSRPTPLVTDPVVPKPASDPRSTSEPDSKKSSIEERRSASKKEQQEKELAALAEYRKQYFQEKQAAAMRNKALVEDQIGWPTNIPETSSPPNPIPLAGKRDDDPYKLVKPPSLEKLNEKLKENRVKKDVDALSASDAEKRHEDFLKWKAEQQKLAKNKKREVDIEVLESPNKPKPESSPSSPTSSSPPKSSPLAVPTQGTFLQGLPTEDPSEIVHNKTIEEEAQDINDYEDMMNNMREILSQNESPTSTDQEVPEEIDEAQEHDEDTQERGTDEQDNDERETQHSTGNSFSKFTLLGATLRLPNVSDRDSLMYRIESLRLFLEDKLGMDIFMKVYHLLNDDNPESPSRSPSSPSSSSSSSSSGESSVDDEIAQLLSEEQMPLLSLIHQLIFCEDRLYDSQ